jgi:hypothetical protein
MPCGLALPVIQCQHRGTGQLPLRAIHDGRGHIQMTQQFSPSRRRGFHLRLPLRLEEQLRIIQNAFADGGRALAPGGVKLAGFPRIAVVLGKDSRHPLAVLEALPRCRHQKPHGHLRRDSPLAHLLLDRFRQNLHQRQPPRHPAHAAVEAPG